MKIFIGLFTLLFASLSYGFILPEVYHSGPLVCELNKSLTEGEFFKWVEVPIDYKNPNNGSTKIYAYTKKAFDQNLPTVIYFTGGPGSSSRSSEFSLPNTNLIFFEQRGISCSRPLTKNIFLDPKFYSSENTAHDALNILKAFGVKKVTSYGQSYGTIPATIFASKYPQFTNALIVEGVIFEGNNTLWNSEIKKNLLQNFFNNLDVRKKERILNLSKNNFLPANWFSKLGGMMLYINEGIDTFDIFLDNVLSMEDENLKSFMEGFYPDDKVEEEFSFGDVMMGMIGCQEISMSNKNLSLTLIFENETLIYDNKNIDREQRCRPLKLENFNGNYYKAVNYPVNVPAFYLLGENDGATDLNQGLKHFKYVAQKEKTILIMKKGGHLPSLSLLKDNIPSDTITQNEVMSQIFEEIIAIQNLNDDKVKEFNRIGPLIWSTL